MGFGSMHAYMCPYSGITVDFDADRGEVTTPGTERDGDIRCYGVGRRNTMSTIED